MTNRHWRRLSSSPHTLLNHRATPNRKTKASGRRHTHKAHARSSDIHAPASKEPINPPAQRQTELEHELQLARDIQQGLLLAAIPHMPGWELSAVSLPARDLGGDLYDFITLPNGWQGIMIGDVSGKGLPAALRMAVARTVFRHEARHSDSPALTLAAVNRGVLSEIPQGMVTMLYAMLDPDQGILRIANAGHTFPILLNGAAAELEITGLPLGVDETTSYLEITTALKPGDSIFLCTDGIAEAINSAGAMYGFERLYTLLNRDSQLKPRALVAQLLHDLRTWQAEHRQSDDVTIVAFRRRLAHLNDELRSVVEDVLGVEQGLTFWEDVITASMLSESDVKPDVWIAALSQLTRSAQERFGRGLARELHQQLRLAIEDYRA